MTWPGWHEPVVLGPGEWTGVAIAHGIVLGIAFARYVVLPRWRASRSDDPDRDGPGQDLSGGGLP